MKRYLGIEFGSTRIKAVTVDEQYRVVSSGDYTWAASYENGIWTYDLSQAWEGLRTALKGVGDLEGVCGAGISGMMHGYLAFDENWNLLAPFRTWQNTITAQAAEELTELIGYNIPQRWPIAHLYQAILNGESHVSQVLLTGGRDLHEFSQLDWILFSVMGAIELLTLIGLFYAAQRCGKHLLPIEQLKHRLRGAIIATHPLPTNNITAVYTDENHTGRIVVCGFLNDDSVYYCVEEIYGNFELETVHTSEIYESIEELPEEGFSALIDITAHL